MYIRIDGDACPGIRLIETIATKHNIKMKIYADFTHNIKSDYAEVMLIDKGSQTVDMKIIGETSENDIIITQDFGLASIVLSKKAHAIGPKGLVYTNDNIDRLLTERFINAKLRKANKNTKGPKKRTTEDDDRLYYNLEELILKIKR